MSSPYQQIILDHYRHPRGQREVADAELRAEVSNPVCGDRLRLGFDLAEGRVGDLHYQARACAVATASASMMWDFLQAEPDPARLRQVADTVLAFLSDEDVALPAELEPLRPLEDLRDFPMRLNCARLSWRALLQGLEAG
jgi:nitrogen fixation NifU-like protein